MKKIIFIIILIAPFLSSFTNMDEQLIKVCMNIIENPEKINNLKDNYPGLYKFEYLNEVLKDTADLKYLNGYIDSLFNRNFDTLLNSNDSYPKIECSFMDSRWYKLYHYEKINKNIRDRILIYDIEFFEKRDTGVCFRFIKDGDKYYIYQIQAFIGAKM